MTLFAEISGQKGENLAPAVLAHILMRCPEARQAFIDEVSRRSPAGPISVRNQFAVFREESTTNEAQERGRLDLVIETDDSIIGVESKFNASFQEIQPVGYLPHLDERAKQLRKVRGREFTHLLIVLAPERRRHEVEERIKEQRIVDRSAFLSWSELFRKLEGLHFSSAIDRFLVHELLAYSNQQMSYNIDLRRLLPHVTRRWAPRGTGIQRDFINQFIWSLLDQEAVKDYRPSVGKLHYGYYIDIGGRELWIALVDGGAISTGPANGGRCALVIGVYSATDQVSFPHNDDMRSIRISDWAEQYGYEYAEILFAPEADEWAKVERWTGAFKPINDLLREWREKQLQPVVSD